jgi:flagellar hook-associated protein 1 FlgK
MTNIMTGSGQPLVLGVKSFSLALTPSEYDGSKLEIAYNDGTGLQPISNRITGGAVAGMIRFRNETLATVNRELGQIALGLTESLNAQQRVGSDLNGQPGDNIFTSLSPLVTASSKNNGTAAVTLSYGDVSAVNARDYELLYNGGGFELFDAGTGASIAMSGSGTVGDPYVAEGMEIVIGVGAMSGDRYLLQPVSRTAGAFSMEMTDSAKIAVAALLNTSSPLSNAGNASVSGVEISDSSAPGLLQPVQIVFSDPTTFRIYDSGGIDLTGPQAYTSGADINFNGWTVQISDTPQAGDQFNISQTAAGSGDNANGLKMAMVPSQGYFSGGRLSVEGLGAAMLTSIGSAAARSGQDLIVQNSLLGQAEFDFQSVSGVNLEEEAANLLRYQEAYMAASKVISVANDLFQTLLATVGR